jgi:hypothetical protein
MLVSLLGGATSSVLAAASPDRNQAAAELFDKYCLRESLDLARLARIAAEARYEVVTDRSIPMPNGQVFRQKNWLIPSREGEPTLLASSDVENGSLRVLGCGIYGTDLDGLAMESALSSLPRMGAPTKLPQGPKGSTVWWSARVGAGVASEDTEVLMSRDISGVPGVSVNLIFKIHRKDQDAK